jgi:hypothetical protein
MLTKRFPATQKHQHNTYRRLLPQNVTLVLARGILEQSVFLLGMFDDWRVLQNGLSGLSLNIKYLIFKEPYLSVICVRGVGDIASLGVGHFPAKAQLLHFGHLGSLKVLKCSKKGSKQGTFGRF